MTGFRVTKSRKPANKYNREKGRRGVREGRERERQTDRDRDRERQRARERVVCWLLTRPSNMRFISGTDQLGKFYVLPH